MPILTTSRGPDPFDGTALRLSVPPLSRRSALAAARRLRPELDDADQERLVDLAGGNPLLLRELGTGGDPTGSPTLDEAVRSRVAALPGRDRAALRLLALRGRPAPRELLGATGTPGLGGLVEEQDGAVWFTHDLLRAAVEGTIDQEDRPALHALLAQRSDDADAAAHHLAAGDADAAAAAAERAAAGASTVERARLLLLAVTARGDGAPDGLRLEAAEALVAAHRSEDAERVAAGVRSDDPNLRASAGWLRARAAWMRGDAAGAAGILDEALALVDGTRTPVEAHLRVERANVSIRDRPGDPGLAEEIALALEVAEHAGVDRAHAHSLRGRSLAHSFQPGWDDHYDQARRIARTDGDPDQECAAMYWSLSAHGFFGPLADALSIGRALIRRADELGQLGWYHQALAAHGLHAASAGVLEPELPVELERLLEHDPEFRNRTHVRAVLTLDRIDRGDLSGAAALIEVGRAQARTPTRSRSCAWSRRNWPTHTVTRN